MKHSLQLLMEQLDRHQDELGRRLAHLQSRLQKTRQTRDTLQSYVVDYRQQQLAAPVIRGAQLQSQGRFIGRMETVLQQQSADVTKLQSEMDRISADLLQARVQRLRYEALLARITEQEDRIRHQREQKATDELSGRRAAAQLLAQRRRPTA